MAIDDTTRKMLELFFCYDRKRVGIMEKKNLSLAHYTTAETAMKILSGRSLWLRNAAVMNDYSEIEYGRNIVHTVLTKALGGRFKVALDAVHEGVYEEVMASYQESLNHAREVFFLTSLSEHHISEQYGRLSMWRAYGGPVAGVAFIFRGGVVDMELDLPLEVSATPVLYGDAPKFHIEFEECLQNIEGNVEFLRTIDREMIKNTATEVLQTSMLSIKHPAFAEEKEWRLLHRPLHFGSEYMKPERFTIGGIPQSVYKIPFHNPGTFECPQLDLDKLLVGIMIGPCAYPETVFRALRDEMEAAGIQNADKRIFYSNVPLRQQV